MPRPELSLVIPIYNEEAVLPQLDVRVRELIGRLGLDCEVVFVNDGSRDRSMEMLRLMAGREPRYKVVGFARNFGHQRAITAGIDAARGKAVVVMDADLQDPPEVILEMVAKWREGFDVVYGRRRKREGETAFKLLTAKLFYRVFAAMIPIEVPLDTGDFRLMSRRVVLAMRELRETHLFVRGLVAWVGFKQCAVEYDRAARAAGETKYPLRKMLSFALDGIASFSILPLRFATYLGLLVGFASVLYATAAVITHLVGFTVPGWTTMVVLVSFLFSVQLLVTGVLGEYIGRIYEQVKHRPLYVVAERLNLPAKRKKKKKARAPRPSQRETTPASLPDASLPIPTPISVPAAAARPPHEARSFAADALTATVLAIPTPVGLGPSPLAPPPSPAAPPEAPVAVPEPPKRHDA